MQLEEVIVLKSQKNVYQIEEDDSKFIYVLNKINKQYISLHCRNCIVISCVSRWM